MPFLEWEHIITIRRIAIKVEIIMASIATKEPRVDIPFFPMKTPAEAIIIK